MPNKTFVFIAILFLTFTADLKAQKANFSAIKESIEAKFWIDLNTVNLCETIVFNGVVHDSSSINSELEKYRQNEIVITELADLTGSRLAHRKCNFIILLGTGHSQSRDEKIRILDSIRTNLNTNVPELKIYDFLCSQCKQVIVDGRPYGIYDARNFVNELKVKDIKYIADYKSANPSVYGRNAVNGLVEIFLTEKKKSR